MLSIIHHMLLLHLCEYGTADRETCYIAMGYKPEDYLEASYALRPLMRYRYITCRSDGLYSIALKGRKEMGTCKEYLASCGGDAASRKRIAYISKVAALLSICGIYSHNNYTYSEDNRLFIPSPCWRKIKDGIISTTRFAGILALNKERLAVYHIGNGDMDWQTYAERSLFFETYMNFSNRATGMLLICDDGAGEEAAQDIVRHTLQHSKALIKNRNDYIFDNSKKRKFSKSPIQLHSQYEKVYLTEQNELKTAIELIIHENAQIRKLCEDMGGDMLGGLQEPDFEVWPHRYFVNPANDLLKYIYTIKKIKEMSGTKTIKFHTYVPEKYSSVLDGYNLNEDVSYDKQLLYGKQYSSNGDSRGAASY